MPKHKWTLRNVKNWSRHLNKSITHANPRYFERLLVKAEKEPTEQKKLQAYQDLVKKIEIYTNRAKKDKLTELGVKVVTNIVSDTALKCSGIRKKVSAEKYPNLIKVTKKYVKMILLGNEKERKKIFKEIIKICGRKNTNLLVTEINNALNIAGDIPVEKPPKKT